MTTTSLFKSCAGQLVKYTQHIILTSLSDVPQIEQHLHSMHCQRYLPTEMIMFAVNWRHVG